MVPANYASLPANCPTTPIPRDFVSRTVRVPRHGVQEFAVLPLALATQKIATNLDILLPLKNSHQHTPASPDLRPSLCIIPFHHTYPHRREGSGNSPRACISRS